MNMSTDLEKAAFIEAFKKRTKKFSLNVIRLFQSLPKTEEARTIGKQLLDSATSVAANYRAVCRARSKKEFFSKLSITVEEADESVLWLELLVESEISDLPFTRDLLKEADEITSVLAKARKTTSEYDEE
jgi:four helix bundle protein